MATPVPAPTEAQILTAAEIAQVSYAIMAARISADTQLIANSKWAATLLDITAWSTIRTKAGNIKKVGSIEFFESQIADSRLAFRNIMRLRYDLPLLVSESAALTLCSTSAAVSVSADW